MLKIWRESTYKHSDLVVIVCVNEVKPLRSFFAYEFCDKKAEEVKCCESFISFFHEGSVKVNNHFSAYMGDFKPDKHF